MKRYEHTQKGPLYLILLGVGAVMLASAAPAWRANHYVIIIPIVVAALLIFLATCFVHLVVRDEGDHLGVWFGPVKLFGRRIAFSEITAVEPSRSDLIDGWGIHIIPGRGIIYNLWGFDCVKLKLGKRTVRIGTDDVDELIGFLQARIRAAR